MSDLNHKNTSFSHKQRLNCSGKILDLETPRVMGILNITPDSFYDGGRFQGEKQVIYQATKMVDEGASIIDIGAVSTRPGAGEVDEELEKGRLLPVLKMLVRELPHVILSVDTYRSSIARLAVEEGAGMINDISGGTFDQDMIPTIAHLKVPFVIMHIQGTPKNMQENPSYGNVVSEVRDFLFRQANRLKALGNESAIIDPGFGFGKTVEHNYALLNHLDKFLNKDYPLLVGFSRKSMINRVLHTGPDGALNGTTVLNTIALMKGADILRVHNVKEAIEAVRLVGATMQNE
jgi:dihydropteroate synthase